MSHVSKEEAFGKYRHFLLDADDYVVSSSGTLGRVATVQESDIPCMLNTSVIRMRPKTGELDRGYLKYFLLSDLYQTQIVSLATGSAQLNYGPMHLRQMFIVRPPLQEQRAIAHTLGTLDNKIELNRRMVKTLEETARALFKSWFVDFDPVRAKAEGRDPGLPPHLADLFPDSFEDSELGQVPRGWEVRSFVETVEVVGGGTPKTSVPEFWGGTIPWFSVVDAPSESDVWVLDTEKKITPAGVDNSSTQVLPVGSTIISARGTVGRVALVGTPMAMNQSCYGLRVVAGRLGFFTYFSTRGLVTRLRQHAHGSVFDTITRETLSSMRVIGPPPRLIECFESKVAPSLDRILEALRETQSLSTLRDTLLPRLISGELRVPDAERFLERVAA
jgi:type I restriction enzyme S subunit